MAMNINTPVIYWGKKETVVVYMRQEVTNMYSATSTLLTQVMRERLFI